LKSLQPWHFFDWPSLALGENTENCFSNFSLPQCEHRLSLLSPELSRNSLIPPHLLHLYSKIGMKTPNQ
jgi:hypothetical protein